VSKILLVLLCVGCLFLLIRFLENRFIYFPSGDMAVLPPEVGLDYENVFFKTSDGQQLNGWFIPAGEGSDTILFSHGNAGNLSHRIDKLIFFHQLGLNVFIYDYRGYGKSQGWPSERGLYLDVQAAYDYLRSRGIPAEKIIGFGESIGGAVTIDLATQRSLKAMILENTFSSMKDMVKLYYPIVPPQILASRFDSKMKIASVAVPKLIVQSVNDEIVPFKLGKELFDAAEPPKEFLEIHGSHNESFFESEDLIQSKLREFLNSNSRY